MRQPRAFHLEKDQILGWESVREELTRRLLVSDGLGAQRFDFDRLVYCWKIVMGGMPLVVCWCNPKETNR